MLISCFALAWDLLKICVYGFTEFATWFLKEYLDSPIRLSSGSVVETLFSQFKRKIKGDEL